MFQFTRIPDSLKPFFATLVGGFSYDHSTCFCSLVLAFATIFGRRNVTQLSKSIATGRTRRGFNDYFNVTHRFEIENLLKQKANDLLWRLKAQKGEVIYLILDDTKNGKRGKLMEALGFIHDSTKNKVIWGHDAVFIAILFRGYIIPLGVRLWIKKELLENPESDFQTLTELGAELIRSFDAPKGVKVRVLFDSFYLCPIIVKATADKGFHWISVLKTNRNLYKDGRKLKVGNYGRNQFKSKRKQRFTIEKNGRTATYSYVDVGWLNVSKIGKAHVVFSRKNRGSGILAIATNDPDLTGQEIIEGYSNRFMIEQFFKDGKQLLGLGQYQNRSHAAAVFHLHMVCFAYALLTHLAITGSSEKGEIKDRAVHNSIGKLQNDLRRLVWEDLVSSLRELNDEDSIIEQLNQLLAA